MLLALDVGNTNTTIGAFQGESITGRWRLRTIREQTADEWGILLRNVFALSNLELADVHGVIICSVVPVINGALAEMVRKYFDREPLFVRPEADIGLINRYDSPRDVGADRVVNGVAAYYLYGGPAIIVDLGTAITFDVISARAEYLGGLIYPGLGISLGGLFAKTALLPQVNFEQPDKLIGTTTVGSIQSGLYHGTMGMVDGILEKISAELGGSPKIIATGGQAALIRHGSRHVQFLDEDLTLKGLRLIWEKT